LLEGRPGRCDCPGLVHFEALFDDLGWRASERRDRRDGYRPRCGAACQQRTEPFERCHSAEEIERKTGLGRTAAGVGDYGVDPPPGETRHAADKGSTAVGGRQVGHDLGIVKVVADNTEALMPK
jgi:hypothetical protein